MNSPLTLQPLLNDAVIALRAPTQVWSAHTGDIGTSPIEGVYHGDVRHIDTLELRCADSRVEWISVSPDGASRVVFSGLLRELDDAEPDPKLRLTRERRVEDGRVQEEWTIHSRVAHTVETSLALRLVPDFASLHDVKSGTARRQRAETEVQGEGAVVRGEVQSFVLDAPGATVTQDDTALLATWPVTVEPGGHVTVSWTLTLEDRTLVVRGARSPRREPRTPPTTSARDARLTRWLDVALADLDALRLCLPDHTEDEFYAAGAPWFFTLFGRDSLWAARLALPFDATIAASTLRVLARLQGVEHDEASAQEPGKILHELRSAPLELPREGIALPARYYGSVDSTALWVCLLADAWRAGMPHEEVRALLPSLRGALTWLIEHGDSDGDGFIDYLDRSGRGLANQGWKDSGDSIQWRDGTLAAGPIALCEVQGYAYEAAIAGAEILEALGVQDEPLAPGRLRSWAHGLRARFAESYWVSTPEGNYPAVALDRDKRPVDTLTSNIGHLIGTGILDTEEERRIATLLLGTTMSSGYGIRTMSTNAAGYWPMSYHGGSVWTHDTAIVARGMARAGLTAEARAVAEDLLVAAEGFDYRLPELHAGDPAEKYAPPTPYPAACRPQAWSAAAAIVCAEVLSEESGSHRR